jgi:hypothetical protein
VRDTLLPRFLAAGGETANMHFIESVRQGGRRRPFDPAADMPGLARSGPPLQGPSQPSRQRSSDSRSGHFLSDATSGLATRSCSPRPVSWPRGRRIQANGKPQMAEDEQPEFRQDVTARMNIGAPSNSAGGERPSRLRRRVELDPTRAERADFGGPQRGGQGH